MPIRDTSVPGLIVAGDEETTATGGKLLMFARLMVTVLAAEPAPVQSVRVTVNRTTICAAWPAVRCGTVKLVCAPVAGLKVTAGPDTWLQVNTPGGWVLGLVPPVFTSRPTEPPSWKMVLLKPACVILAATTWLLLQVTAAAVPNGKTARQSAGSRARNESWRRSMEFPLEV